ncbi:MAG TPA: DNA topoisomerase, partial [Myxococcota bacterium]|nr:DNA topoisomerase [Myxococcota bacterium]
KTTHDDRLVGPDAAARAEALARAVAPLETQAPRPAHIHKLTREEQREVAPPLFDLTALQKLANQRFGLSSERTLNAAQALYERHKAITYPRTDSRFLTQDIAPTLPALLRAQHAQPWSAAVDDAVTLGPRPQRKVIDDAEVGDHHAILPTDRVPDLDRLSPDERKIYELVARRFVAVFLPPAIFDKRTVITVVDTGLGPQHFRTEGRARVALGWHAAEPPPKRNDEPPLLPDLREGAPAIPLSARPIESKTQPPKRYTEATLLSAMEHAGKDLDEEALRRAMRESGLGTPATRASIIETLLKRDYIRRDGRMLVPTPSGRALIASLPMPALRSAELTGRWEARLAQIADGRYDATTFMDEIRRFTREAVQSITSAAPPQALGVANTAEVLGQCPVCGTAITLGRKAYSCERKRDCTFVVFTKVAGKTVSPNLLKLLLSKGRSSILPGFKSKAGKRFKAALVLGNDGTVTLDFGTGPGSRTASSPDTPNDNADIPATSEPRPSSRKTSRQTPRKTTPRKTPREPKADSTPPKREKDPRPGCPLCKTGYVMVGRAAWGCTRWREGCKFVVPFEHGPGRLRLPDDEADRLLNTDGTALLIG